MGLVVRTFPIIIVLATLRDLASPVYAISSALYYAALLIALLAASGMAVINAALSVFRQSMVWFGVGILAHAIAFIVGHSLL